MSDIPFSSLPLAEDFLANLDSLEYRLMTPIQAASLPAILDGRDLRARAKTGSGKTAAFGIGLLQKIDPRQFQAQALILCPTRELADQVGKELRRLARPIPNTKILTLCGGTPLGPQLASLEHPPQIVVGTPGRILKHCRKGSLKLDQVATLVLDEADRMLDMGFADDIDEVVSFLPPQRQTLLFSATYPEGIEAIGARVLRDPLTVEVESVHQSSVIRQQFFEVPRGEKTGALVALLRQRQPESCVVFCGRKQQCQELADELKRRGLYAQALHGDMEQKDRDRVLVQFANRSVPILCATDVAARGLDISGLAAVVNYELSPDPEIYVHRIGRTGRAGNEGLALSLFHTSEAPKVVAVADYLQQEPEYGELPAEQQAEAAGTFPKPAMQTLCINSGRKNKLRPGDILGALTAKDGLQGSQVGKIDIFDFVAYVAVPRTQAEKALQILGRGKIKGRKMLVKRV